MLDAQIEAATRARIDHWIEAALFWSGPVMVLIGMLLCAYAFPRGPRARP
jgi:hypothetical protein